jgi:hypothetical protein
MTIEQLTNAGEFDRVTQSNLQGLIESTQPGARIFLGQTASQARDVQVALLVSTPLVFERTKGTVWAVDPSDDYLCRYPAMIIGDQAHFVANGEHITPLFNDWVLGKSIKTSLVEEPTSSDETPKISGLTQRIGSMTINRFSQIYTGHDGMKRRTIDSFPSQKPGYGEVISAFTGNPPVETPRDPLIIPVEGETAMEVAEFFWNRTISRDVLSAIAVKTIERRTGEVKLAGAHLLNPQVRPL